MGQEIILLAAVFVVLFFIGGIVGVLALPDFFPMRFFAGGLVFGAFGTGAGSLVINR